MHRFPQLCNYYATEAYRTTHFGPNLSCASTAIRTLRRLLSDQKAALSAWMLPRDDGCFGSSSLCEAANYRRFGGSRSWELGAKNRQGREVTMDPKGFRRRKARPSQSPVSSVSFRPGPTSQGAAAYPRRGRTRVLCSLEACARRRTRRRLVASRRLARWSEDKDDPEILFSVTRAPGTIKRPQGDGRPSIARRSIPKVRNIALCFDANGLSCSRTLGDLSRLPVWRILLATRSGFEEGIRDAKERDLTERSTVDRNAASSRATQ
jgi:hypothetical protein